jgi:hypothetical protein
MPGAAIYVLGALFMAISFYASGLGSRFLFTFLAFAVYESYILPVFAFYLFIEFRKGFQGFSLRSLLKNTLPAFLSAVTFVVLRLFLSWKTGSYQQPVSLELVHNSIRIFRYQFFVFTSGYSHRFSSITELSAQIVSMFLIAKRNGFPPMRFVALLLGAAILSSSLDLFVPYEGIRVVYGSYFFKASALIYILLHLLSLPLGRLAYFAFLLLLLPLYANNLRVIYKVRKHNYLNQANVERLVSGVYREDEPSKTMFLPPNPLHFHPQDWALEPNSTIQLKLFRYLQKRTKDLNLRVIGYDSLNLGDANLPLLIPSRSFVNRQGGDWERDENARTGQVFHIRKGFYGNAIWGPYFSLGPGLYEVELFLRTSGNKPAVSEFGSLNIRSAFAANELAGKPLVYSARSGKGFQRETLRFRIGETHKNMEFVVFSNGQLDISIDFFRLRKIPES